MKARDVLPFSWFRHWDGAWWCVHRIETRSAIHRRTTVLIEARSQDDRIGSIELPWDADVSRMGFTDRPREDAEITELECRK